MNRFFIYARKSTDEAHRQVRSIEAQIEELRELARKESLTVIEDLVESQTAKYPGRLIFTMTGLKDGSGHRDRSVFSAFQHLVSISECPCHAC